jgi:hypothetical protein
MKDNITVSDFLDAKTFLTTTDASVLLRIRTSKGEQWYRLSRENYAGFAAFLTHDAAQLMADH